MIYKDHLGNEYPSFSAMCRSYGKDSNSVRNAVSKGKSLENALTEDGKTRALVLEVFNKKFSSYREVAKFFNINYSTLCYRAKAGENLEQIITSLKARKKDNFIEYRGKTYKSVDELCNEYKVDKSTFVKMRIQGASLEDIFGGDNDNE